MELPNVSALQIDLSEEIRYISMKVESGLYYNGLRLYTEEQKRLDQP